MDGSVFEGLGQGGLLFHVTERPWAGVLASKGTLNGVTVRVAVTLVKPLNDACTTFSYPERRGAPFKERPQSPWSIGRSGFSVCPCCSLSAPGEAQPEHREFLAGDVSLHPRPTFHAATVT